MPCLCTRAGRRREDEELGVLHRGFAGIQQVVAVGIAQRPVVVLARSVDARERLFVQQANVAMPPGRAAHHFHRQHVVVRGDVHILVHGSDLKLAGSHFVVAGVRGDAEREKALLHILHVGQNPAGDAAEDSDPSISCPLAGFAP